MKSSEYPEEFSRKFRGNTKFGFLGIYRRNSEEISIRRNIPRKFRGNIIAVGEPFGDFTKFRGNSDELTVGVGIPSEFPRSVGRI
ncbi:hypothetical protein DY000_02016398 [Brassica cretica]|uniref:Uncharacterized protein n=1 Tax=Brassica cretica TaxID=69181 RepID=A0ABQ7D711_BRACR|nr:hypothetical protein DY000_02016398 [Brassica cretica]